MIYAAALPHRDYLRQAFEPGGPLEVWCHADVADYLGCKPSNVASRKGLPEPLFRSRNRPFWLASDIREFVEGGAG